MMDIEKLIEQLNNLECVAYGYNINGEVLGMECTEFECLMVDASTALSTLQAENEKLRAELEQVKKKNKYSAHDVALILSDAFGDSCACNFNGNDEWLPEKCELLDTRLGNGVINVKLASQHETAIHRLVTIEDILGDEYDLDRLRELAEADREGRCVVLPCKIGDIVYEIRYTAENDRPRKHARKRFDHSVSGCTWRMREQPEMCYVSEKKCTKSDFEFMGRTVFLTREEAEAALAKLNSET